MKRLITFALILLLILLPGTTVLAYLVSPTSVTISDAQVYRNLAESGDQLIVFHYSMPYASDNYSTTPASVSVGFKLVASNSTLLQTGHPFVNPFFESNGYGEGMGAFYFAAADAQPTWGSAAVIQISLLPAFFSPSTTYSLTLTASDYESANTTVLNRAALQSYILLEADTLASDYSATGVILKTSSDSGIVLSPYGELYFGGVIPGLQSLCPDLYFIQSLAPTPITMQTFNTSKQTTYTNRLVGNDLGKGFTRMGALINLSGAAFAGLLVFAGTIFAAVWTTRKGWGAEPGLGMGAIGAIGLSLVVGDVVFTWVMVGSLLAGIGIVWIFLLKRA